MLEDRSRTQREEIEELASHMPTEGDVPPRTAAMHASSGSGGQQQEADRMLKEQALEGADQAKKQLDAQRTKVAGSLDSAASALRSKSSDLPGGEMTTRAANTTADTMQRAAGYMQERDLNEMTGDLQRVVRDHPMEAVAAAFAVGLIIGWTFKS